MVCTKEVYVSFAYLAMLLLFSSSGVCDEKEEALWTRFVSDNTSYAERARVAHDLSKDPSVGLIHKILRLEHELADENLHVLGTKKVLWGSTSDDASLDLIHSRATRSLTPESGAYPIGTFACLPANLEKHQGADTRVARICLLKNVIRPVLEQRFPHELGAWYLARFEESSEWDKKSAYLDGVNKFWRPEFETVLMHERAKLAKVSTHWIALTEILLRKSSTRVLEDAMEVFLRTKVTSQEMFWLKFKLAKVLLEVSPATKAMWRGRFPQSPVRELSFDYRLVREAFSLLHLLDGGFINVSPPTESRRNQHERELMDVVRTYTKYFSPSECSTNSSRGLDNLAVQEQNDSCLVTMFEWWNSFCGELIKELPSYSPCIVEQLKDSVSNTN